MSDSFITLGVRSGWGDPAPFGISQQDRRQHLYVIGKTGSGKTTLLKNIITQHIAGGGGVGVIDPHGDLSDELLDCIPPKRISHLCYFNPGDFDFPIAFNPLSDVPINDRHLVASGMVSAFKSLWRDSWGPRLEYILYNAVAALLDCENTSLLGINRLLTDDTYRIWVVRQIKDPFIRDFWEHEYAGYEPRFQREVIAPIQNKVGQFTMTPAVRNILGQVKSRVDCAAIMDNGRIFIANLSKGMIGHDKANLLGSLLVTQFQLAAMARANRPEEKRRDFHLIIDEFHNFSTDAFASILAEARKYRLCLTLSHQYIDQLSLPVRQAVFGNVGTIIAFRVGYSDAEILEKEFGHAWSAQALSDLNRYEAIVKLLENGEHREPFKATMLPPAETRFGKRDALIVRSREKFAVRREIIENRIERWLARKAGE